VNATITARTGWRTPLLLLLGLVPAAASTVRLAELATGAPVTAANARFFAMPAPAVLHLLAVLPFVLLGAVQFAPAMRRRWPRGHRATGQIVVACGFVAALSGLWMTQRYPWPAGDGEGLYWLRWAVGSAMVAAFVLAIVALRRRDFAAHGAWMTRAYALGLGAGTQVLTHLPWFLLAGKPGESARTALMGAGWAINLIVAEWLIRRRTCRGNPARGARRAIEASA
jgi:uncharacterized membrane protein